MTFELFELQLAATLEVKLTVDPVPPLPLRLMELPEEQELQVMVIEVAPTVTVAVPVKPLFTAVIVTPELLEATPVTCPVPFTVTRVVSELVQVEDPVTFFVLPSSKLAVAVSWVVPPIWTFVVLGATVTPVSVGFTKKSRQPTPPKPTTIRKVIRTNHLR
jgi:hypothetical protein